MKGLKRFTANMIMGANVASIILMLLVGYSDRLNPQEHPMLSCLGLTFPAFLLINVCFLVFWAVFSLKRVIVPLLGFLLCYGPVRTYFPLNLGTAEEANLKVISYNVAGYSADEAGVRGGGLQGALDYVAREESKRLLVKLGAHNVVRANQVRALARYIGQHTDVPVIFCGDFNDTPISYSRYVIGQHLTDCFRESGNGLGWSFWRDAIRVRIDHIFCSSQLTPVSCNEDDSIKLSDHYPMICGLKMDGNAQK